MKKLLLCALCLALCACLAACGASADSARMWSVNAGKADAHLIEAGGKFFLVDAGTADAWAQLRRTLAAQGVARLEAVFLTHTDKDHAGGLSMLAQSGIEIGAWYSSAYCAEHTEERTHPGVIAAGLRGQNILWMRAGDTADFGTIRFTAVAPSEYDENENDNSLVLLAQNHAGRILLAGDMCDAEESRLLLTGSDLRADVLKVAYHGGAESTSLSFLTRVSPRIAVISTSTDAREETPSPVVTELLTRAGCAIFVTQDGTGGVLCALDENAAPQASYYDLAAPDKAPPRVSVTEVDARKEIVRVTFAEDTPLDGWYVVSSRGGEGYAFPASAVAKAGVSLSLGTLSTAEPCDFTWPDKNVLHDKKNDVVTLYDPWGRAAATYP